MDNHEHGALPGFRFHPTDEEIVSFYLRRKIEKKLGARIDQFIKQMDIYKYDPWDLAKNSDGRVTDMEWYFFCKRGRKYRNSIRPNRVTGSGFWKATGIDKAIYSSEREGRQCVGLKKSLVFYRGSAGKGTKTDWMMHEFRLPDSTSTPANAADDQQVEVWTLCRILKRNMSYRKLGDTAAPADHRREVVWKTTTDDWENFAGPAEGIPAVDDYEDDQKKKVLLGGGGGGDHKYMNEIIIRKHVVSSSDRESSSSSSSSSSSTSTALISDQAREFFAHGNWDELVSAGAAMDEYEYAFDHFLYSRNTAFASI